MPNQPIEVYSNRTLHGGVNQRLNGRQLADNEATDLINADISVPGLRTKRKEPSLFASLLNPTIPATPNNLRVNETPCGSAIILWGATPPQAVTLQWGAVVGASYYRIKLYIGLVCGGGAALTDEVPATQLSYPFATDALEPGEYSWTVQAIGDEVNYDDSNVSACCSFRVEDGSAVPASCAGVPPLATTYTVTGGPMLAGRQYSGLYPAITCGGTLELTQPLTDNPWDGTITYVGSCVWKETVLPPSDSSWEGYQFVGGGDSSGVNLSLVNSGSNFWQLIIPIVKIGGGTAGFQYVKTYGASPVGTYNAVCPAGASPSSLVVTD